MLYISKTKALAKECSSYSTGILKKKYPLKVSKTKALYTLGRKVFRYPLKISEPGFLRNWAGAGRVGGGLARAAC